MTTPLYAYQIQLLFNIADHKLAQLTTLIDEAVADADLDLDFTWYTTAQYVPYQEYADIKQRSAELAREEEDQLERDWDEADDEDFDDYNNDEDFDDTDYEVED